MAKYHGKGGYLILEGIGVIEHVHGWTLTTSSDKADVSEQGKEWKESVKGQRAWNAALSAWYNGENVGDFYDILEAETSKDFYLYPRKADMTRYFYGDSWCDFELNTPLDGGIDIRGTVDGTDQLFKNGM